MGTPFYVDSSNEEDIIDNSLSNMYGELDLPSATKETDRKRHNEERRCFVSNCKFIWCVCLVVFVCVCVCHSYTHTNTHSVCV